MCTKMAADMKTAKVFCRNCSKYYCLKRSAKHDELFRKHVCGPPTNGLELCDKHQDKPVILLCKEHSALCCRDCVTMDHRCI